jgi:hypothetical protein
MGTIKTVDDVGAYLIEQSEKMQEKCRIVSKEYYERFNITGFYTTDIMPTYISEGRDVEGNLNSFMVTFNNNMITGIFAETKMIRLTEDLEVANDKIKKESARKRAAFLFILLNGLEDQFKDFLNKHGVDDDEVQEAIREFHNN